MVSSSSSSSSSPSSSLPLTGLKVVEFAGLAPGPMVGLVLADFGADVIRIDKVGAALNADGLCRGKRSIAVDPKTGEGLRTLRRLIAKADVLIDPFRPNVLERLGLGPAEVEKGWKEEGIEGNARLVYARLTGFQRTGPYANMAGHDINYIALSGLLSMLGPRGGAPQPPINLLGDFAGGSLICLIGILLALLERSKSGKGQVVEADMVTGARYVASFLLLTSYLEHPSWGKVVNNGTDEERGTGMLDGGAPWYGVYRCKDGGWMSVGAIEPQFYSALLSILKESLSSSSLSHPSPADQHKKDGWPALTQYLTDAFLSKSRSEWENIFVNTDACCVPVLTRDEAAVSGITPGRSQDLVDGGETVVPSPAPRLARTPAKVAAGSPEAGEDEGEYEALLPCGEHTREVLKEWVGLGEDEMTALARSRAISGDGLEVEEDNLKSKL
ncbi:putative alpha-methylacyl-CoA racemase [Microstroma glucosiphilum]|uniref:Putative alpha-methylacyl-CoA racemase n=1 Tax=Pseudomicrostroma glucosiphilum TaxID=1684307 RepID=A0A316U143_9BASI|nr:putative alpha-methylacyl-CoA racemase [Pseudomicrostroma glucosiphilum]PWN19017.1 putative alpha-methylacyl-CoA racemase [Pseudomicrostroma glucosiphilum]